MTPNAKGTPLLNNSRKLLLGIYLHVFYILCHFQCNSPCIHTSLYLTLHSCHMSSLHIRIFIPYYTSLTEYGIGNVNCRVAMNLRNAMLSNISSLIPPVQLFLSQNMEIIVSFSASLTSRPTPSEPLV